ncbi:MAG: polysaccharide deacetylase family protein, partial [Roseiflexus castenholzii]
VWAAGGILLMHGRPSTAGMLPGIIDRLRAVGLEPTTLSETLR